MAFDDDGWFVFPGAVGPSVVASCVAHLARTAPGPVVDDHLRSIGSLLGILAANLLRSPVSLVAASYVAPDAPPSLVDGPGEPGVVAWLALDPPTSPGGLRVAPGSGAPAVEVPMSSGDVAFVAPALVHEWGPGTSDAPRRVLRLRFAASA